MSDNLIFETIRKTRSVRQFKDEPLPKEAMQTILEAGRLSGSAKNSQPWQFVVVTKRETLQGLSKCGQWSGHLAGAAMAVALVTTDPFARITVPFDLGRTAQNMMVTARSLGVGSVMATIYQSDKAREILNIPPSHVVPWCISFGYPVEDLDRPTKKGGRLTGDEVIHWEVW